MTYVIMGFVVLFIATSVLWGIKYSPAKQEFMSVDDSTYLRGFWCLIVVLVHVPAAYHNTIQDVMGSFAYIGVTFFFMTSAYGLCYSISNKPDYMYQFWRKRLPSILVPALIVNVISSVYRIAYGLNTTLLSFVDINAWVKVLLLYYAVFGMVYGVCPKFLKGGLARHCDVLNCYWF